MSQPSKCQASRTASCPTAAGCYARKHVYVFDSWRWNDWVVSVAGPSARVQQADGWCRIPLRLRSWRPNLTKLTIAR